MAGTVVAVVASSVLFGLAHTEYGIIGVAVTFVDALFFSVLRLRYRTLWASVLAHGLWNTLGIVGFFLVDRSTDSGSHPARAGRADGPGEHGTFGASGPGREALQ